MDSTGMKVSNWTHLVWFDFQEEYEGAKFDIQDFEIQDMIREASMDVSDMNPDFWIVKRSSATAFVKNLKDGTVKTFTVIPEWRFDPVIEEG